MLWIEPFFERDAINAISAEKEQPEEQPSQSPKPEDVDSSLADHYETLQISPNADFDTVARAYRILAQRYQPDNGQTGDEAAFRMVREAFHVLSDPENGWRTTCSILPSDAAAEDLRPAQLLAQHQRRAADPPRNTCAALHPCFVCTDYLRYYVKIEP